jgi:hypothetical protein
MSKYLLPMWLKRLLVVAALCAVAFFGWHFYLLTNNPFNDWWFDETRWKAEHNKTHSDSPRGKMAYDVKHRVVQTNMTRRQVVKKLGPPDAGQDETSLSYHLGSWSGFRMDGDILVIEFGKSGRVTRVYWFQT